MGNTGSTETRTWHLLFWVEIFKITISEPEGRRCLSAKVTPGAKHDTQLVGAYECANFHITYILHLVPPFL
jgi:hypothetical protein